MFEIFGSFMAGGNFF